jgi:iron complex outermembrane receptor protein
MAYASYSTGFKSGGINAVTPTSGLPLSYEPEEIKAVQLGTKSRFLDERLQINAELFSYHYDSYQALAFAFDPSAGVFAGYTLNSQSAKMYGGELEGIWLVAKDDRIDFNFAYLEAKFGKFIIPFADISGFRVRNTPKYTATLGYEHVFHLAGGANLAAHLQSHFTSWYWTDDGTSFGVQPPSARQGSFTNTQVDVTYKAVSGNWSASLWARNLEDKGAIASYSGFGFANGGATALGFPYPPRTVGVRVSADFH